MSKWIVTSIALVCAAATAAAFLYAITVGGRAVTALASTTTRCDVNRWDGAVRCVVSIGDDTEAARDLPVCVRVGYLVADAGHRGDWHGSACRRGPGALSFDAPFPDACEDMWGILDKGKCQTQVDLDLNWPALL